jgi:predicted DCC family thiol-disulfide oxidoreductase YuxK
MSDPEARLLLEPLPVEERFATWHLASVEDRPVGYGKGAVELLAGMALTRPAARVLRLVPGAALDSVYRLVARERSRLGRLVPDRPGPRRFP